MQTFSREVVLAGDGTGQPGEDDVLAALAPRFTLGSAAGPAPCAAPGWTRSTGGCTGPGSPWST